MNLAVGTTNGYFPNIGGRPWGDNARCAYCEFWNGRNQWLHTWNLGRKINKDAAFRVDYVRVYAV